MQAYTDRGFKIKAILGDGQFQHIQQIIQQKGVILNICSANEHVPEIERYIRTLKERVRSIATILPFKKYPPRLIVEMVSNCVFWLNSFPRRDGVHNILSPRAIMTGQKIHYDKHCRLEFGTYVQVHEKHNNSMDSRTSGAIALSPSGNEQGGHYFLSLHTRKRILRNHWTVLPMPNDAVDVVHRLAATSKQTGGITFTDKEGNIIMEDDESDADDGPEDVPIPVDDDMDDIHVEGIDTRIETTGVGNQVHDTGNTEAETGKKKPQEWTMARPEHMLALKKMYKYPKYTLVQKTYKN